MMQLLNQHYPVTIDNDNFAWDMCCIISFPASSPSTRVAASSKRRSTVGPSLCVMFVAASSFFSALMAGKSRSTNSVDLQRGTLCLNLLPSAYAHRLSARNLNAYYKHKNLSPTYQPASWLMLKPASWCLGYLLTVTTGSNISVQNLATSCNEKTDANWKVTWE